MNEMWDERVGELFEGGYEEGMVLEGFGNVCISWLGGRCIVLKILPDRFEERPMASVTCAQDFVVMLDDCRDLRALHSRLPFQESDARYDPSTYIGRNTSLSNSQWQGLRYTLRNQ